MSVASVNVPVFSGFTQSSFYKQKKMDKLKVLQKPKPRCWCISTLTVLDLKTMKLSKLYSFLIYLESLFSITRFHSVYLWINLRLHRAGFALNSICAQWLCVLVCVYVCMCKCVVYVCVCAHVPRAWGPFLLNDNRVEVSEAHNDIQRDGRTQVIPIQTQVPEIRAGT